MSFDILMIEERWTYSINDKHDSRTDWKKLYLILRAVIEMIKLVKYDNTS